MPARCTGPVRLFYSRCTAVAHRSECERCPTPSGELPRVVGSCAAGGVLVLFLPWALAYILFTVLSVFELEQIQFTLQHVVSLPFRWVKGEKESRS